MQSPQDFACGPHARPLLKGCIKPHARPLPPLEAKYMQTPSKWGCIQTCECPFQRVLCATPCKTLLEGFVCIPLPKGLCVIPMYTFTELQISCNPCAVPLKIGLCATPCMPLTKGSLCNLCASPFQRDYMKLSGNPSSTVICIQYYARCIPVIQRQLNESPFL